MSDPVPAATAAVAGLPEPARQRVRLLIRGAVQGVGFRPYVFRLARELGLGGWVGNSAQGVTIEVEGPAAAVRAFLVRLEPERPPRSFIQSLEPTFLDPAGLGEFAIRPSEESGAPTALILPDIATCPDCLRELFDPHDRRFGYPFINCTHCGPRFSIIERLPYDRPYTSMHGFAMCPRCAAEYANPADRRFHAQPNACPECGPRAQLWDRDGRVLHEADAAIGAAVEALRQGAIVAVKGLGGFHLLTLATDDAAVQRLRARKHREAKPLALMFPSLAAVAAVCSVSDLEARLLRSPEAPIVLLRRRADARGIAPGVAPRNPTFGVMLPYTPLHHLLLARLNQPVVATSGNQSDEPICTDEHDALRRLGGIADVFLVHNRPIVRHVDDSIVRVVLDRELVLRRARGYAPLPIPVREALPRVLAAGAHLKNAVALGRGREVFLSQHRGDLETLPALEAFERTIGDLTGLLAVEPEVWVVDLHPDYPSSRHARRTGRPVVAVQHHYAHVLAGLAENELDPPVLGVSWDGTGYGTDGCVWGGEFLSVAERGFERVAHLRPFVLPGGEAAVRQPRRIALGLLYACRGERAFELAASPALQAFTSAELNALRAMLARRVNCPVTTSVGRLFDAAASLAGLRQETQFEGQTAMELEFALPDPGGDEAYPLPVVGAPGTPPPGRATPTWWLDWAPLVDRLVADVAGGVAVGLISARFHNALVSALVEVARRVGERRVVLTGGCFQNRYLLERAVRELRGAGFQAYWHQRVPPNDGGIALGQAVAAGRELRNATS
jgi:hydrogenase maturation protein HypF